MDLINRINQELSLWKPQRLALSKFHSTLQTFKLTDDAETIKASIPGRIGFDTNFPSFTFDMATGSGKTRLMGACIEYLYLNNISKNFFVLAPGDTIYRKLIEDFTIGNPRFVLSGWSDIPHFTVVTGENYESYHPSQSKLKEGGFTVFIFNIDKFRRRNKESLKFHKFREALGASFGEIISKVSDLVLLMDESHHYRADITKEAIEGLKPILGLEFTATPIYKKNIIYSYSLGDAERDGIIKILKAIIRKNDRSYEEELEELKLIDGLRIHKNKKVILEKYCKNFERPIIKPIAFISTKNIKHGEEIQKKIESDGFMNGEFKGKTIFVHSGSSDDQIKELLKLEDPDNDKEIVIHVNKLKEGWDVRTIYTIIPLRASISEILVEQTLGRGVRLPFYDISKEDIEQNQDAFTLSVITYKIKGDNYKDVIDSANKNSIIVKEYEEDEEASKDLVLYTINPENKKFLIKVPVLDGVAKQTGRLGVFDIEPQYEKLKEDLKAELESVRLTREESETIEGATQSTIENQVAFLVKKLIEDVDELDFRDKDVVMKIANNYLKKATKSSDTKKWKELLKSNRRFIFEDIRNKVQERVNDLIKVTHRVISNKDFEVKSYSVSIDKENGIKNKDNVLEESIKRTVVKGYKKSIFSENKFDSKQEKWLADIMDRDKNNVKKWMRNQNSMISIKTRFGKYYPDFIAETDKEYFLIEVKSSAEVTNPLVLDKAREAVKWCKKASKVLGKKWSYKLISHDKIIRTDDFEAVISNSINIE